MNSYAGTFAKSSLVAQMVKPLPTMRETQVQSLGWEDPLEKEMATHSSTLAWKFPWMEERDRLRSMGSQRVGHDWETAQHRTDLTTGFLTYYSLYPTMLNVKSLQHCSIFPILPPILCFTVVIHSLLLLHIANPIIQLLYTYIYIYIIHCYFCLKQLSF